MSRTAFQTDRLHLRAWCRADAPFLQTILGDEDVMRYSDGGALAAPAQAAWLDRAIAAGGPPDLPWFLALERCAARDVIGYVSLTRDAGRVASGEAEIGFRLTKAAWGQGYGLEAARAVIAAAAEMAGIQRLVSIVDPHNARCVGVLRKLAMVKTGEVMFAGYDYADDVYTLTLRR